MSDDYQEHNIYRYTRKTYKQNRNTQDTDYDPTTRDSRAVDSVENIREIRDFDVVEHSPRNDDYSVVSPECRFSRDPEGDIANILHKKCPVITLAQQQLTRLLDENSTFAGSFVPTSPLKRSIRVCQQFLSLRNKSSHVLMSLILVGSLAGLLLGAATCGTHNRKFNNPILNCIDSYFISDLNLRVQDSFRSIT